MNKAPDWMKKRIADDMRLFGIDPTWRVTVSLSDKPGGDETFDGHVHVDWVYQNAKIEMNETVEDDADGQNEITHEVLHIALHKLFDLASETMNDGQKAAFRSEFENTVQRISRSINYEIGSRIMESIREAHQ